MTTTHKTMTVRELIDHLQMMDPGCMVWMQDQYGGTPAANCLRIERVEQDEDDVYLVAVEEL